jgi:hypothetical protein
VVVTKKRTYDDFVSDLVVAAALYRDYKKSLADKYPDATDAYRFMTEAERWRLIDHQDALVCAAFALPVDLKGDDHASNP